MILDVKKQLKVFIQCQKAVNTHSHHLEDHHFHDFDLSKVLSHSYISWSGVAFDDSHESRKNYLDKVRFKSYFIWLNKAVRAIYGFDEDISVENWDRFSEAVATKYREESWRQKVFKDICRYEKVILDAYWQPGSDNDDPDLFAPVFRIDPLLYGFDRGTRNHDGFNASDLYGWQWHDLDSYLIFVRALIEEKKTEGCVGIKCAIAYDRGIDFRPVTKEAAGKVFDGEGAVTSQAIKDFQDYVFYQICKIAGELGLPVQCHTGLGGMEKTNAIHLRQIIKDNPCTRFILFHGGYPWTDDVLGLLHVYGNVYPDICWLPILSPTAAEHALHQLIEVGTSDKICWGGDTWTVEESYGARLAMEEVLTNVLAQKVDNGYFTIEDAKEVAVNLMYRNAKKIYNMR